MNEYIASVGFNQKYQAAIRLYEKAKKRLAEGDADDTLTAARKSLEFFVKDFCKNCGLPIEDDSGLAMRIEDMINSLKDAGLFEEKEISLLHNIRRLGNVGSHGLADLDKAQEAVGLLDKAVELFAERDNEEAFAE